MTSMRKLRRRLLRQQRYADRTCYRISQPWAYQPHPAFRRAAKAVERENERRAWAETPEVWLGGPAGEAALIADVLDEACPYCRSETCAGDCDEAYAEDEDDLWPPDMFGGAR